MVVLHPKVKNKRRDTNMIAKKTHERKAGVKIEKNNQK